MSIKEFFSPNTICIVCGEKTGLAKNKLKYGYICSKCIDKLLKCKINISKIYKSSTEELKATIENLQNSNTSIKLIPLQTIGINLKKDEVCFYEGKAQSIKVKNIVTHYQNGHSGFNIKIAKGISFNTGRNTKVPIRENVSEKYPATFYITNMRLVLIAEKYGFDVKINNILSIDTHKDGFKVHVGEKTYSFLTNDVNYIIQLFEKINKSYNEQIKKEQDNNSNSIEEVRAYKKLYDEGIITLEEFSQKKKQLLNL